MMVPTKINLSDSGALAASQMVLAELEEQNAQEGMALTITEKAEWLTPGLRAMVAAIRNAKRVS